MNAEDNRMKMVDGVNRIPLENKLFPFFCASFRIFHFCRSFRLHLLHNMSFNLYPVLAVFETG